MKPQDSQIEKLLNRVSLKPVEAEKIMEPPKTRRKRGPAPVPALDPHVEASYLEEEGREMTVPAEYEADLRRMFRQSAKYVSAKLEQEVKVTIKVKPARTEGKIVVQFFARPPLETGSRHPKYGTGRK